MLREVPKKYIKLYDRAMTGKSRTAAVRSFCLECVSYSEKEIRDCSDSGCPLYKYRLKGAHSNFRSTVVSQTLYIKWRDFVIKKYGSKCSECDSHKSLEAHHLVPIHVDVSLIIDKNNGICLCKGCHDAVHEGTLILEESYTPNSTVQRT